MVLLWTYDISFYHFTFDTLKLDFLVNHACNTHVQPRGKTNLNFSESESFRILLPNPKSESESHDTMLDLSRSLVTLVIVQILINMVVI